MGKSMMSSGRTRILIIPLCITKMTGRNVIWWTNRDRGMATEIKWPYSTRLDNSIESRIILQLRVMFSTAMIKSIRGWSSLLRIKGREVNTEQYPVEMQITYYHRRAGATTRGLISRTKQLTGLKLKQAIIIRLSNKQSTRRRVIMRVLLPTLSTSSLMRKLAGLPTSTTAMQVRGSLMWEILSSGCRLNISISDVGQEMDSLTRERRYRYSKRSPWLMNNHLKNLSL